MVPVCMVYSTLYSLSAGLEASAASLTVVSTAAGPLVSVTELMAVVKAAEKEDVMPE